MPQSLIPAPTGNAASAAATAPLFDPRARASYRHITPVSIRFADLDTLGHVNNIAFNVYIEQARVLWWVPLLARFGEKNIDTIVLRVSVDYLAELNFPGDVVVGARLSRIGTKSMVLMNPVFTGTTCHAVGECVIALFDKVTRRTVAPGPVFRAELERMMREG
jgi:acyl-CoA thioester hydrolase